MSLAEAVDLRGRCDYRGALAALAHAEEAEALVARSRLHEDFGEYAAARADAEQAGDAVRLAGVALAERNAEEALALTAGLVCVERGGALEELARLDEAAAVYASLSDDDPLARLGRGSVCCARGDYAEAERELLVALELAESRFGAWSIEAAGALNALGMTYKYWGRFDDGRQVYERALAILVRAFGDEHVDVATVHHNLGGLEHARRDFAAAEPHARRSVELRRRALWGDHLATAEDEAALAPILHGLGQDAEAEALLRHAIEILERELGAGHPETAAAWNNLAGVLDDPDAAAEAYRRALAAKEVALGADHPSLAITLNNLGVNARRRGRDGEAEAFYRRAIAILESRVELEGNRTEEEAVRLAANTNEDSEAEVEAHRVATNSNETVDRIAMNKNETVERLAANKSETVERLASNTNEETAEDV
jgi:tetratricopeptide (TPR) repeat protein